MAYIEHQKEVVTRRTAFDKEKAEARAHILAGLLIALDHIDEVIRIIRNSETDAEAQAELMAKFELSERQSQAILDMRLRRLTGLERDKIQSEYDELIALIADLADILAKPERVIAIIKEELDEVKRKFADDRRTELMVGEVLSLEDEDLIEEADVLITLSNKGYIKRLNQAEFTAQKRRRSRCSRNRCQKMTTLSKNWCQRAPTIDCSSLLTRAGFIVSKDMKSLSMVGQPRACLLLIS